MRYITAAVAMLSGFVVLAGYLYPLAALTQLRVMLTDWAIVIAAGAVLVGIFNMIFVQLEKLRSRQKNSIFGVVMILALILTFGLGMALTPAHPSMRLLVDAVIVPVEASLMAILAVTLVYASIRLLRRRTDMMTVIFLLVAVLTMIAILPTPIGPVPGDWLILMFVNMFSSGGARGLLIGVALGSLLTSLRVLVGIDRPYGGN